MANAIRAGIVKDGLVFSKLEISYSSSCAIASWGMVWTAFIFEGRLNDRIF